jgi:uncharacterized Zn finger protein (UPF0148 family)
MYEPESKTFAIYALYSPADGIFRYVGKTNDANRRVINHIAKARRQNGKFPVQRWILELLNLGLRPQIQVLEFCELHNWGEREKFWIQKLKNLGFDLLNRDSGGGGPTLFGNRLICKCGVLKHRKKNGTLICKVCSHKYQVEYNKKNKILRRAATKEWYFKNQERIKKYRKEHCEKHNIGSVSWYWRNQKDILEAKRRHIPLTEYRKLK